jgi:NAD(P)H-dependent FMN reductase
MSKLSIPIIIGTGREGRLSEPVAQFVHECANAYGFEPRLIDVRDFATLYTEDGEKGAEWKKIVTESDAFILIVPEYNHSYPGELKILLDKAYKEYNRKPVGVCTVSAGGVGGTRVAEHLLPLFNKFQLISPTDAVYFTKVKDGFPDGQISDDYRTTYTKRLNTLFTQIESYAKALG